jgi:hypothetical protein
MAIPNAPRIKTFSFVLPLGQILVLSETTKRIHLGILRTIEHVSDVAYIWVGPDVPATIATWIPLSSDGIIGMTYERGCYGPIYVAMAGAGDGRILIQSNLVEADYATLETI